MNSGTYAIYTGLLARTQALETAANNLANANTTGFRAQRDYFRGMLAGFSPEVQSDPLSDAVNHYSMLGGSSLDLRQGHIASTGNPLDLAVDGDGFFRIKTSAGVVLTRDGAFQRSGNGTLTTQRGEPVLDPSGTPVVLPAGNIHIGPSGDISVSLADGSSAIAGRVDLVSVAGDDLAAAGGNRFVVRDGARTTAASGTIQAGSLEGANQDAVQGTMQLMLVQRQAEMMQKALTVFHNDFDKTATEELGRV